MAIATHSRTDARRLLTRLFAPDPGWADAPHVHAPIVPRLPGPGRSLLIVAPIGRPSYRLTRVGDRYRLDALAQEEVAHARP